MKIRVISSKEEIGSLMPNEKMVHMAFRASNVDFLNLMQRCPRLRTVIDTTLIASQCPMPSRCFWKSARGLV